MEEEHKVENKCDVYNVSSDGGVDSLDINYTTIGGAPCWFKNTRPKISLKCKTCGKKLILIGQFNAPLFGRIHIPYRCIYVFGCNSDHFVNSVVVIRGQCKREVREVKSASLSSAKPESGKINDLEPSIDSPSHMSPPTISDLSTPTANSSGVITSDSIGVDLMGMLGKAMEAKAKKLEEITKNETKPGPKTALASETHNSDNDDTYIAEWSEGEQTPNDLPAFAVKITDADEKGEDFVYKDTKEALEESEPDDSSITPEEARYQHVLREVKGLVARYGLGMFPVLPCPVKLSSQVCPYCGGPTHIELELFSPLIFITGADEVSKGNGSMEFCVIIIRTCKNSCDVKSSTIFKKAPAEGERDNWSYCVESATVVTEEAAFGKGTQEV